MLEHGAIALKEDLLVDMDGKVRVYANEIGVVGGMVDLAETEPVLNDRLSEISTVRDDVGGIKQLHVRKPAHAAPPFVGEEDPTSELRLMKSYSADSLGVAPQVR